jgi:hypothetical protein
MNVLRALPALLLVGVPLAAQDAIQLTQEWRAGHRYRQRISQQMDQSVRMPGTPASVRQQLKQIQETVIDVEKNREDGGHFGNVAITELRTRMLMGGAAVEFDSRNPAAEDQNHPLAAIMRPLMGIPIGYDAKPDGSIIRIALPEPKEKTPETDKVAQQIETIFSQVLTQATVTGLPKHPVKVGDRWPENRSQKLMDLGEVELNGEWIFTGYQERNGINCAMLVFRGKLSVRPDYKPKGRLRILTARGNAQGQIWFDPKARVARRSQIAQDVKLRMIHTDQPLTADGSNEIGTELKQMFVVELLDYKAKQ